MTDVAILGAGGVGRALAERMVASGVSVRFGARDPSSVQLRGPLAAVPVLPLASAAAGAALVLVAVPADVAVEAVRAAGDLTGTILVDCTNPLQFDGGFQWAPPAEGSVTQQLATAFPAVSVVKGFNHFGVEIQRDPRLAGGPADAFFASDDQRAKSAVMEVASRMGFRAHDAGPLRNAAALENLAVLWIQLSRGGDIGREFAFRIEQRA